MSVVFQQDLEPALVKFGHSKEQAHSLGLRCCATFCYHKASSTLGLNLPSVEEFVFEVYRDGMPGAHHLGVHHGEMATLINSLDQRASLIVLDPLRIHGKISKFKKVGMYSGKESLKFFKKRRRKLNKEASIVNTVKQVLDYGGIPIIGAIQKLSNGYIGSASKEGEIPTHDFVVLDFNKKKNLFTIFDPDKRAFENLKGLRPKEMQPIASRPAHYTVPPDFLEKSGTKIYNEGTPKQRLGGIIIGIFKS